jgi:3',5'-cyclic AMP phosphodiesterase CpdA
MVRSINVKKLASIAMLLMAMASPSLAANEPQAILLAAGDITGCDDQDIKHAASTAAVLAREIRAAQQEHVPVKAVILGDLAYGEGTKAQFECFHRAWGKVLDESLSDPKSGVLPVPGNHDYKTQNGAAYYRYYESNRQVGPEHQPYYQLSFPAEWLILGLNSEIDGTAKSAQYAWLKKNLAASAEPCVLALWYLVLAGMATKKMTTSRAPNPSNKPKWRRLNPCSSPVGPRS